MWNQNLYYLMSEELFGKMMGEQENFLLTLHPTF